MHVFRLLLLLEAFPWSAVFLVVSLGPVPARFSDPSKLRFRITLAGFSVSLLLVFFVLPASMEFFVFLYVLCMYLHAKSV